MQVMIDIDAFADAVFVLDNTGRIVAANDTVRSSFEDPHNVVGRSFPELGLDPALSGLILLRSQDVATTGASARFTLRGNVAGRFQGFDLRISPIPGRSDAVLCVGRNLRGGEDSDADASITQRDERLSTLEELYHNAPAGYVCVSSDGVVHRANRRAFEWLSFDAGSLTHGELAHLLAPESALRFLELHRAVCAGEAVEDVELEVRATADRTRWLVASGSIVRDEEDRVLGARYALLDATARHEAEQCLRRLALTDELTGLYNRRGFRMLVERELALAHRRGSRGALLFVDVDGLKHVNDTWGHEVGSELLVRCADLLRRTFRDCDLVGRLSGDEFAVFLPDCVAPETAVVRLRAAVDTAGPDERGIRPQMSIGGVAVETAPRVDVDEWLTRADAAMYEDKRRRRSLGLSRPRLQAVESPAPSVH